MSKYLDVELGRAIDVIREYLHKHAPGGSIRLSTGEDTLVILTQDSPLVDALNDTFELHTSCGLWDNLVSVNMKESGEC